MWEPEIPGRGLGRERWRQVAQLVGQGIGEREPEPTRGQQQHDWRKILRR